MTSGDVTAPAVALPTEGVDRNNVRLTNFVSLATVALPTEGVDRNNYPVKVQVMEIGRPPHGGRG